ncbi:MAG TPA: hypothetical protein PKD37_06435 [Oligoflexia bacterium]|nr:hypothetical protein [Oligoflexia bacterium]HMP27598.1 hypothetical protein [Oligoflexia bacterium]
MADQTAWDRFAREFDERCGTEKKRIAPLGRGEAKTMRGIYIKPIFGSHRKITIFHGESAL